MSRVTLDQAAIWKLREARESVAICDASGRVFGSFQPTADKSPYEGVEVPFTEEELRQAEMESGGLTTSEVLAFLKNLERR